MNQEFPKQAGTSNESATVREAPTTRILNQLKQIDEYATALNARILDTYQFYAGGLPTTTKAEEQSKPINNGFYAEIEALTAHIFEALTGAHANLDKLKSL